MAFIAGILYLADSLVWIVTKAALSSILQYVIWTLVVLYCIIVMISQWKTIADKSIRTMCLTMIIISFAMLPVAVSSMLFPSLRGISISLVSLSYTIAILVFLFIAIARLESQLEQSEGKKGISFEVPEREIQQAVLRAYHKLKQGHGTILLPILEQLKELRERELRSNRKISDIDKEIAHLTEQNLVLVRLKSKGYVDPAL